MTIPKIIFSDFDGTLTINDRLESHFFDILKLIETHKLEMIIVTGRSQAWGHFLLTHFPFSTAITEGGGCISRKVDHDIEDEFLVSKDKRDHLTEVSGELIQKFPGLKLSADSQGRVCDRAIELYLLEKLQIKPGVEKFLEERGVFYSSSNVHLNFWNGNLDKFKAISHVLDRDFKKEKLENCLYFGDSLNDQSVFKDLKNSVGVSNISSVMDKLKHRPSVVLKGPENIGSLGVLNYLRDLLK